MDHDQHQFVIYNVQQYLSFLFIQCMQKYCALCKSQVNQHVVFERCQLWIQIYIFLNVFDLVLFHQTLSNPDQLIAKRPVHSQTIYFLLLLNYRYIFNKFMAEFVQRFYLSLIKKIKLSQSKSGWNLFEFSPYLVKVKIFCTLQKSSCCQHVVHKRCQLWILMIVLR